MRRALSMAFLLLLALALAGCSKGGGSDEDPSDGEEPDGPDGGGDDNATQPNRAPAASIQASITNGTAPLAVNFTLDASDEDQDLLNWTLDADGDGTVDQQGTNTTFPHVANFTFGEAGNFTANFTVSDGMNSTSRTLSLSVGLATETVNAFIGEVTTRCNQTCENLGANLCDSFRDGEQGGECIYTAITPEMKGRPFTATSTGGDPDLSWTNTCEFPVDVTTEDFSVAQGPEEGNIPDSAECVVLWAFAAAVPSTITFAWE